MMWLWIGLAVLALLASLFVWGACVIGAQADDRTDKAFWEMMERRSHEAGGVLHEGVTSDADGS